MVEKELAYVVGRVMKEDVRDYLDDRDINHFMTGGFVVKSTLGSHILLRESLERLGFNIIFYQVTGDKMYVVKWSDLTVEKQAQLSRR